MKRNKGTASAWQRGHVPEVTVLGNSVSPWKQTLLSHRQKRLCSHTRPKLTLGGCFPLDAFYFFPGAKLRRLRHPFFSAVWFSCHTWGMLSYETVPREVSTHYVSKCAAGCHRRTMDLKHISVICGKTALFADYLLNVPVTCGVHLRDKGASNNLMCCHTERGSADIPVATTSHTLSHRYTCCHT